LHGTSLEKFGRTGNLVVMQRAQHNKIISTKR
jgi:hypothetical protein